MLGGFGWAVFVSGAERAAAVGTLDRCKALSWCVGVEPVSAAVAPVYAFAARASTVALASRVVEV